MHEVQGAILAGGRSSRMGRDKATLRLGDGRMMIEHVATALASACANHEIIVAAGSDDHAAVRSPLLPNARRVLDLRPQSGPLAGIEAILASNLARHYLIVPCDAPWLTADLLRLLLREPQAIATVLRVESRAEFEPLPARIAAAALPMVQRLLDEDVRSVWRLMEALPAAFIDIDAAHAPALRNVNTPDDLNTA